MKLSKLAEVLDNEVEIDLMVYNGDIKFGDVTLANVSCRCYGNVAEMKEDVACDTLKVDFVSASANRLTIGARHVRKTYDCSEKGTAFCA